MTRIVRYLMQHPSGYIYAWTEVLSLRKDMSEIAPEEALKRLASQAKGNVIPAPTAVPIGKVDVEGVADQLEKLREQRDRALALLGMKPGDLFKDETPPEGRVIMDVPSNEGESAEETPGPSVDGSNHVSPSDIIGQLDKIRKEGRGKVQVENMMREHFGYEVDRREKLDTIVEKAIGYIQSQVPQHAEEATAG